MMHRDVRFNHPVLSAVAGMSLCLWAGSSVLAQSSRLGMGSTPYSDSGGGVTFRVWAPNATTVAVPGSFNGWNTTANYLSPDTTPEYGAGYWSADIPAASPGDEYKYHINGSLWKKDPRGRQVFHSQSNTIIYDPGAYDWTGDTRLSVDQYNTVIYEMHVGAFYDSNTGNGTPGTFADAITKLDHLVDLGVNAVELLPIWEFPGDFSWGYNPSDPYAVEGFGYGGPNGLKDFVKAAHDRGIRVMMDVVHNHYGPNDLDLWSFDTASAPGIYFYSGAGICCTSWGDTRPNFGTDGVRSFIIDNFRMWMDEYHIDGFRWDSVGTMREYDSGSGYVDIPEADTLISYINNTLIHSEHPGVMSIAEDQAFGMGFDGEWDRGFGDTIINQLVQPSDSSRNMYTLQGAMNVDGNFRVMYVESHDLVGDLNGSGAQRLPKRIDSGDPDSYFARKRAMLGAAVILTIPGKPMLFMGQEMLEPSQFSDGNPLDWTKTNTYSEVVNFFRDMIHLRRNLDGVSLGLTGGEITWHDTDNTNKIISFHRHGAGPDDQVMVVMNWANASLSSFWINGFPVDGTWYVNLDSDWTKYGADFGNQTKKIVEVSGGTGELKIGPYSVVVLSRQAHPGLDSDDDGLLNGWEQLYYGGPTNGVAGDDTDEDGASSLEEQGADTNPTLADSVLKITDIHLDGGDVVVKWKGGQAVEQRLRHASLPDGTYVDVFTNLPPTPVTNVHTFSGPFATSSVIRVEALP